MAITRFYLRSLYNYAKGSLDEFFPSPPYVVNCMIEACENHEKKNPHRQLGAFCPDEPATVRFLVHLVGREEL